MIERLFATRLDRQAETGRTKPGFLVCENVGGDEFEVVVKLSHGCDLRERSLSLELFAACLAGGLGLPVPQPFLVEIEPNWLAAVSTTEWGRMAAASSACAFGSKRLPTAFRTWIADTPLVGSMTVTAAAVLLFDAITDNPDRRPSNPNCLVRGDDIRIIDHELALSPVPIIGWRPPWAVGGMHALSHVDGHIFYQALRRRDVDWDSVAAQWESITDDNLARYRAANPPEWAAGLPAIDTAIEKIRNARANMSGCITEVQRLLA